MNFYRKAGELIFGTRLKRISDKFLMDVAKVYKSLDINFEISWFPLFYLLKERGELSVTEIANELEITHSAISQLVTVLEKKKLIKFLDDENDRRKRLICFTQDGRTLLKTIIPVWGSIKRAMQALFTEGENSAYILLALDELEESMEKKSFQARVRSDIKKGQFGDIEIIPFQSKFKRQFKDLILNWLIENYDNEVLDVDSINDPEKKIKGGSVIILMARIKDECAGTIVARIKENSASEILYLVVAERWQRRQIGKKLLFEAIKQLEKRGIKNIHVEIDRRLTNALKLFKKMGFILNAVKTDKGLSKIKRTSLLMELKL